MIAPTPIDRVAWPRVRGWCQRRAASLVAARRVAIDLPSPIVSFTFDDFPRSALRTGGVILERFGARGTYYTSFGLMDQMAPPGRMFALEDVIALVERGHELGCHTFHHCHAWETSAAAFERSVLANRAALEAHVPRAAFATLSYPLSPPRPRTKQRVAAHFAAARGGGQTLNATTADLNHLHAYFLEKANGDRDRVNRLIEQNRRARGWLIFATHDVCDPPSPFGCRPDFFARAVHAAAESGARILTVAGALEAIRSGDGP